mmetsp:Transcript_18620/g.53132  ORF Transcript_18620/g.53132 Transcript_18620/m.53132 type:complete len:104 (+) Transcript_18620:216-527(+)
MKVVSQSPWCAISNLSLMCSIRPTNLSDGFFVPLFIFRCAKSAKQVNANHNTPTPLLSRRKTVAAETITTRRHHNSQRETSYHDHHRPRRSVVFTKAAIEDTG